MKQVLAQIGVLVILAGANTALAGTLSVEQDGSGDWTTIQGAVDAAASGDTIMIGAGRYSELHPAPNSTTVVAYLAEAKDLRIIGAGQDEVIIGPEAFVEDSILFYFNVNSTLFVSGVQFVNGHEGIRAYGDIELCDSSFMECWAGGLFQGGGVEISNCVLSAPEPAPVGSVFSFLIKNSPLVVIESCHFLDLKLYIEGVSSSNVGNSVFEHQLGTNQSQSINFVSSNGVVEGITTNGWVNLTGSSKVVLRGSTFNAGLAWYKLSLSEQYSEAEIFDNVFHGGTYCTLYLSSAPSISGSGNHILNGGTDYSVKIRGYGSYSNSPVVDLRNNYWGTDDPAQIDAWIYDIHDDPSEDTEVLYQPFSDVPLPTEKKSLDGFKSLYR